MSYQTPTIQTFVVVFSAPKNEVLDPGEQTMRPQMQMRALADFFMDSQSGNNSNVRCDTFIGATNGALSKANGLITASGASGSIVCTVNGVTSTVTASGGDPASMTLLVAAIVANASALVKNAVQACNLAAVATCVSAVAGDYIEIDRVRITLVTTKGGGDFTQCQVAASDNAQATALTASINTHPYLSTIVFAIASTNTVTVRQITGTTGYFMTSTATRLATTGTSSGKLAATAIGLISSIRPEISGNWITLAASGTGMSASVARLAGAVGGDTTAAAFSFRG